MNMAAPLSSAGGGPMIQVAKPPMRNKVSVSSDHDGEAKNEACVSDHSLRVGRGDDERIGRHHFH